MSIHEINVRRAELHVELGVLAEQFAAMKTQMIPLEVQEAAINRELAELALDEIRIGYVSHGGRRNAD